MRQLIVRASGPLRGSVTVPGDKSISHRALLLGGLAEGDMLVRGWLPAEDCQATLRCARALGIHIEQQGDTELIVHGAGLSGLCEPADVLDCGGSGTTMRLLAGILAGQPFTSVLTGSEALRRRPMARVADPLRLMGATVLGRQGGKLPPLSIAGGGLYGIDYSMPVASAQVKSALMLAALFARGETVIHEPGPARDHTERMLRLFGLDVDVQGHSIHMHGGQTLHVPQAVQRLAEVNVPADFSSAAFPLVAGALVPGSAVRVADVCVNPTRTGLYDLLIGMGAQLSMVADENSSGGEPAGIGEPTAELLAVAGGLRAIDVGGDVVVRAIDEFPIFAVAATQAEGVTTVRDASELRVKETDRIGAVAHELGKMGAHIEERPDGLVIHGPTALQGAVVESHRDHRLSMALAVAALVADGETTVRGAEAIEDSFPGFVEVMRSLGADIEWA